MTLAVVGGTSNVAENPKAACGAVKPLLGLVPAIFTVQIALALAWGARKYGRFNWRKDPVRGSTYVSAMERHLALYAAGEDVDPETGVSHLGHVAASCAILLDAAAAGTLRDDRSATESLRPAMEAAQALMATWPEPRHELFG